MFELSEIVPRPARVAKCGRCAEGPGVKTMLGGKCIRVSRFRIGVLHYVRCWAWTEFVSKPYQMQALCDHRSRVCRDHRERFACRVRAAGRFLGNKHRIPLCGCTSRIDNFSVVVLCARSQAISCGTLVDADCIDVFQAQYGLLHGEVLTSWMITPGL